MSDWDWDFGGSDEYKRRMEATDFGTRFTTQGKSDAATVPKAWQWFLVSGGLYYFRLRQSAGGHFRITKTVLKATTYVTGTWCVVDLAAVLGASNMSWLYDETSADPFGGKWRDSYNLLRTRRLINNFFAEMTVVSGVGACFYETWLQGGRISKVG
jgi:hypothetical protein